MSERPGLPTTGFSAGQLPHYDDAEQAVLGGLLMQPQVFPQVAEHITPEDFYRPSHKTIFEMMLDMERHGEPLDLVTLTSRLKEKNKLEESGGAAYIAQLLDRVTTTAHIEHHAKLISESSLRRNVILAGQEITSKGIEGGEPIEQYVDFTEKRVFEVTSQRQKKSFIDIGTILKANLTTIEALFTKKENVTGISTGFADMDKITSGLQPSDLVILAARPSMGKTALAMNIAANVGLNQQGAVAIFSLEMAREQIGLRLLSSQSKIDSRRLRTGQLHESDWKKLVQAINSVASAPIYIDDTPNLSVLEMRSACRRLDARNRLSLIVVDYLQLMRGINPFSDNRVNEISEISRGLKALAKELSVPVIALSQLNRSVDSRPDKRPMMSDLRESGAIEQDADVIMFIYRDEVYNKESPQKGVAEIIFAKQRNGPTGTVNLTWLDRYTSFENFSNVVTLPQGPRPGPQGGPSFGGSPGAGSRPPEPDMEF